MAIENHVILNGQICKVTANEVKKTKEIKQINIVLKVLRRPNKTKKLKFDLIPIRVRDEDQINYIMSRKVRKGDFLEVSGVFNNVHVEKSYRCRVCGEKNQYDGTIAYVTPLCLEARPLYQKESEIVWLSEDECDDAKKIKTSPEIMEIISEKKHSEHPSIDYELVDQDEYGMDVRVYSQEEATEKDAVSWMVHMGDISNRIYIIGNLCGDPEYYRDDKTNTSVTTYQLGVDRKVFIKEDNPNLKSDYPYIKSLGEQADKDKEALRQGSLIFVDGALQAREKFTIRKECENCGAENEIESNALEIVPYAVEYLRNCMSPSDGDDFSEEENMLNDIDIDP